MKLGFLSLFFICLVSICPSEIPSRQFAGVGNARDFEISADGKKFVSCGPSFLQCGDMETGEAKWLLKGNFTAVAISPDGSSVVAADAANSLKVFNASNGNLTWLEPTAGPTTLDIAFDSLGHVLADTGPNQVTGYDFAGGHLTVNHTWNYAVPITSVRVLGERFLGITHQDSPVLRIYDTGTFAEIYSVTGDSPLKIISRGPANAKGFLLQTATLSLYKCTVPDNDPSHITNNLIPDLAGFTVPESCVGAMSQDTIYLTLKEAVGGAVNLVALTRSDDTFVTSVKIPGLASTAEVDPIAIGNDLISWKTSLGSAKSRHRVWAGARFLTQGHYLQGHSSPTHVILAADGSRSISVDDGLYIVRDSDFKVLHLGAVSNPVASGIDTHGAFAFVTAAGEVSLYDKLGHLLKIQPGSNSASTAEPTDTTSILATGGAKIYLYSMQTGDPIRAAIALPGSVTVLQVAFSPDGRYLMARSSSSWYLYTTSDWKLIAQRPLVGSFRWHPDSRRILSLGSKLVLRIVGTTLSNYVQHTGSTPMPDNSSWAGDARYTFSTSENGGVKLDSVRTATPILALFSSNVLAEGGAASRPFPYPNNRNLIWGTSSGVVVVAGNPYPVSPPKTLVLIPNRMRGTDVTARITIEGVAPAGGTAVTLATSDGSVSLQLNVKHLAATVDFKLTPTTPPAAPLLVPFVATTSAGSKSATLQIDPAKAPAPVKVTASPIKLAKIGDIATVTVKPARGPFFNGDNVTLPTSKPTPGANFGPSKVPVPMDATTATFKVIAVRMPTKLTAFGLTATTTGGTAKGTISLAADTGPLTLTASPSTLLTLGATATVTAKLKTAAPKAGTKVTLSSALASILGVVAPASVTVPSGKTTATFKVRVLKKPGADQVIVVTGTVATGKGATIIKVTK